MSQFTRAVLCAGIVAFFACIGATPAMACQKFGKWDPCGPNNPVTKRIPVEFYTVKEIVPCYDGTRFYIIASNGRQWHNAKKDWDWGRIRIGSRFRIAHPSMVSGVLHGDVEWL